MKPDVKSKDELREVIRKLRTQVARYELRLQELTARQSWIKVGQGEAPPDRFLGVSRWGHVDIYTRRCWGDRDWLVNGYYLPRDIRWWMPLPEAPEQADKP